MKKHLTFLALLGYGALAWGQTPTQTIRGSVVDKYTHEPLIGATVQVMDLESMPGTVTDFDGMFVLEDIPAGYRTIECSYVGYQKVVVAHLVKAAQESVVEIQLEGSVTLQGVEVVAHSTAAVNPFAPIGSISISGEELQGGTTTANDLLRHAQGLPGVQPTRDNRSDIVIRGNSPVGMLWRLEGIDIPNPNHFARRGSSGGGITIFSISLLDRTDFSTGAFSAEYGNALSGVFDVRFRKGNDEQPEYTFRAGLLGLDLAAEGPIRKGKSSYLVNYRYSTLGILNRMGFHLVGERIDNDFQDLSFNLHFSKKKEGEQIKRTDFNFWGISGLSAETKSPVEPAADRSSWGDKSAYDFTTNMGATGLSLRRILSARSSLQLSMAVMLQDILVREDTVSEANVATTLNREEYLNGRVSVAGRYNLKLSDRLRMQAGGFVSELFYDLQWDSLSIVSYQPDTLLRENGHTTLLQPFVQFSYQPAPRVEINFGLHGLWFALNERGAVEPRINLSYYLHPQHTLSLAYGLHSLTLPIGTYLTRIDDGQGQPMQPNRQLDLARAHHLIASYAFQFGKERADTYLWRLLVEGYYQRLYRVPVESDPASTYWMFNETQGYARVPLVSDGVGRNIGADVSLHKFFRKGTFMTLGLSVFDSQYRPREGSDWHSTQYNSGLSASFLGGKIWKVSDFGSLETGLKVIYNRGLPITPLLENPPVVTPYEPPEDDSRPYSQRIEPYFRPDLRIAYRRDRKVSWLLALDIQNVINRQNEDGLSWQYEPTLNGGQGGWEHRLQSGLTPVLSFQIDF